MAIIHSLCEEGLLKPPDRPCQDYLIADTVGFIDLAVCADGLSECSESHIGSNLVCKKAMKRLKRQLSLWMRCGSPDAGFRAFAKIAVTGAFEAALCELIAQPRFEEKLSTLAMAVVNNKTKEVALGVVGDSGVALLLDDGSIVVKQQAEGGLGSKTNTLLEEKKWRFSYHRNVKSLLVATDGVLNALLSRDLDPVSGVPYVADILKLATSDETALSRLLPKESADWANSPYGAMVSDDRTICILRVGLKVANTADKGPHHVCSNTQGGVCQ